MTAHKRRPVTATNARSNHSVDNLRFRNTLNHFTSTSKNAFVDPKNAHKKGMGLTSGAFDTPEKLAPSQEMVLNNEIRRNVVKENKLRTKLDMAITKSIEKQKKDKVAASKKQDQVNAQNQIQASQMANIIEHQAE